MSRIGKMPITLPAGVEVKISSDNVITVKGPKGELSKTLHQDMIIEVEDNQIIVKRPSESKNHKSLHGLTRALINNMVIGVTKGFEKTLEISGIGYRALKKGNVLTLNLGYSHPIEMVDPDGIETVAETQTKVIVKGISKEAVGAHAANIRAKRPPEPYKGHGIKYADEHIRRKVGKTG